MPCFIWVPAEGEAFLAWGLWFGPLFTIFDAWGADELPQLAL
jgi:hypothetical protein